MKAKRKHYQSLIEVMIAFTLVVMCILPLVYPHVFMVKAQHQFTSKIELDNAVNLLYGDTVAALQMNRIPWNDIIDSRQIPINDEQLKTAGFEGKLPYQGSYQFSIHKKKSNSNGSETAYLLNLVYTFAPTHIIDPEIKQKQSLNYRYQIFLVYGQEMAQEQEEDDQADDQENT